MTRSLCEKWSQVGCLLISDRIISASVNKMSVAVSSAPVASGADADNRMLQRRDSMAADERAKNVSKLPYDENVGKLNKFYRQGNDCPRFTNNCS